MGITVVFGCDLFKNSLGIDSVIKALMKEARVFEACCEGRAAVPV